jgi:pyruvate ferredoxin oxidoreductase gamma subunit
MLQIRIHGRGGQGVVTAAELLSAATFSEGKHAQAFPSFGSERTGAPVVSFCRIDDKPIRVREPVMHPDGIVIQDPTLLDRVDVFEGASPDALLVINSARPAADLGIAEFTSRLRPGAVLTVPATDLREHEPVHADHDPQRHFLGDPEGLDVQVESFLTTTCCSSATTTRHI